MKQQIHTFEELYPYIADDGIYLCEDTHTSYWPSFGGGHKRRGSFIEYSKNWVDNIHAWHSKQPSKLKVSNFTRTTHSVHYYDSIVVLEKRKIEQPVSIKKGTPSIPTYKAPKRSFFQKVKDRLETLF